MRRLSVCVDGVPLLFRSAGVKNYLFYWLAAMERAGLDLRVYPRLSVPTELNHEGSVRGGVGTLGRLALWHLANLGPHHLLDGVAPPSDIFHAAKLLYPPRRVRLTATIHDTTVWSMPELHTAGNVAAEKLMAERVWNRADGLIAVSEQTRQDAVRMLGIDERRIEAIHHGIAPAYFEISEAGAAQVRKLYALERPYVLFVGTVEPRKNVALLLDAWQGLPEDVRREFALVLAGPAGWASDAVLERLKISGPDVRYLGYVPEPDLPGLFAGAALFAYVSLYEGFGFPVAQAMAAGVPVLTSAVSALPEIAGGAAELVDPRSEQAVRDALGRLLTSDSRRRELAQAGRRRAADFRWERCAQRSLAFFERVAGRGGA
jgi:alpha-1,3-rhamnosyl/mannosyltransferase